MSNEPVVATLGGPWRLHSPEMRYQCIAGADRIHFYDYGAVTLESGEWKILFDSHEAESFTRALKEK